MKLNPEFWIGLSGRASTGQKRLARCLHRATIAGDGLRLRRGGIMILEIAYKSPRTNDWYRKYQECTSVNVEDDEITAEVPGHRDAKICCATVETVHIWDYRGRPISAIYINKER